MKSKYKPESLGFFHHYNSNKKSSRKILLSPDDSGVIRNYGRSGSRFAPAAITEEFLKLNKPAKFPTFNIHEIKKDSIDFDQYQSQMVESIAPLSENFQQLIHVGGGHDHIYPLLKAQINKYDKIIIFNIDAHLDTRVSDINHSGTPFRQLDKELEIPCELYQIGIHQYANSLSTQESLKRIKQIVVPTDQINKDLIGRVISTHDLTNILVVLSLDADGLSSSQMEAVSAVNHFGIDAKLIFDWVADIKKISKQSIFGIYEYNPLFDNLSNKGAKLIASLLFHFFSP